jgi:hypothetical protein
MRVPSLIFVALPAVWAATAHSQDSTFETIRELLCEQCPFDAPVRTIRRDEFSAPQFRQVITAEDMRALGVISVSDMINQLSNRMTEESESSESEEPADSESPNEAANEAPASSDQGADEAID